MRSILELEIISDLPVAKIGAAGISWAGSHSEEARPLFQAELKQIASGRTIPQIASVVGQGRFPRWAAGDVYHYALVFWTGGSDRSRVFTQKNQGFPAKPLQSTWGQSFSRLRTLFCHGLLDFLPFLSCFCNAEHKLTSWVGKSLPCADRIIKWVIIQLNKTAVLGSLAAGAIGITLMKSAPSGCRKIARMGPLIRRHRPRGLRNDSQRQAAGAHERLIAQSPTYIPLTSET